MTTIEEAGWEAYAGTANITESTADIHATNVLDSGVHFDAIKHRQMLCSALLRVLAHGVSNDEDARRWLINYGFRYNPKAPVRPVDVHFVRSFNMLCAEFPDLVSRHWDQGVIETGIRNVAQGIRKPTVSTAALDNILYGPFDLAKAITDIRTAVNSPVQAPYAPDTAYLRTRPRDSVAAQHDMRKCRYR